jgi:hypothetical protein
MKKSLNAERVDIDNPERTKEAGARAVPFSQLPDALPDALQGALQGALRSLKPRGPQKFPTQKTIFDLALA